MHLILHLGPHKTGTTYIQRILWRNREALAHAGWLYPDYGRPSNAAAQHDLARRPDGRPDQSALAEFQNHVTQSERIILSSEKFARWSADDMTTLADCLDAQQVTLVCYLRDPFDRFYSYWKELIKQGNRLGLPEVFAEHFADPHRSALLNPLLLLRRFAKLDERFSTRVICYDALVRAKQDICTPLWHDILGVDAPFDVEFKHPNRSFSIETTEFLRALLGVVGKRMQINDARALTELMTRARLPAWRFGLSDEGRKAEALLSTHLRPKLRQQTLDRNCHFYRHVRQVLGRDFRDMIEGEIDPAQVFAGGQKTLTYYDSWDLLSEPAIRNRIEALARQVEIGARGAGTGEHALG